MDSPCFSDKMVKIFLIQLYGAHSYSDEATSSWFHLILYLLVSMFFCIFRAFQGLCVNEFKGLQFDHEHSFDLQNGEQVKTIIALHLSISLFI